MSTRVTCMIWNVHQAADTALVSMESTSPNAQSLVTLWYK